MYAIHIGGVGFLRLSTKDGATDYECRILEALGDETIIAVGGHVDVEEACHFRVGTYEVTAICVATSSAQTRRPDNWVVPQWRPPAKLVREYYRHVDHEGLSLSASEALPAAHALAPAPVYLLAQLEEGLQSLRDQLWLLQGTQSAFPGRLAAPVAQYSIVFTSRSRGAAASSSWAPQDFLAAARLDPALASLGPLLGGAAVSGARGAAGAGSDDSTEDGARGFPTAWGRPTINVPVGSAPIGVNNDTPFMQPARSMPPPPPWGVPAQEVGPLDMHVRLDPSPSQAVLREAAQLIQNLKAKIQSVFDGDEDALAFKLTGVTDPLAPAPHAGEEGEMALVAAHAQAASQLAKNLEGSQNKKNPENPKKNEEE